MMTKMCIPVPGAVPCDPANPFRSTGGSERGRNERRNTLCVNDRSLHPYKRCGQKNDRILIPSSSFGLCLTIQATTHGLALCRCVVSLKTLTLTWWPGHLLEFGRFRTLVLWGIKDSGHAIEILVM